ncbi:tRNA (adenosine(37)-N6)-dimethylallyltransferase MiaA, partial [Listeria monocytogenes]
YGNDSEEKANRAVLELVIITLLWHKLELQDPEWAAQIHDYYLRRVI